MSSVNREFYFSLSTLNALYFFFFLFCLIVPARTSSTVSDGRAESGRLCLVPDLGGKAFSLSPWAWCEWWVFRISPLSCRGSSLLFLVDWMFLSWRWVRFCQMLFPRQLRWCVSFLHSLNVVFYIDFQMWSHLHIPGVNPSWSRCKILLMCCWILSVILLQFLPLYSWGIVICSFLVVCLSGFGFRIMLVS